MFKRKYAIITIVGALGLGLALIMLVRTGIDNPDHSHHTLQQLGISNPTFDRKFFDCGRDMSGGDFKGTFQGSPVSGHYCCGYSRCYYSLD